MPPNSQITTTEKKENSEIIDIRLNFLLEITQTLLALGITAGMLYLAIKGLKNEDVSNSFFLIVGYYFGKALKTKAVGLGIKATQFFKSNV